MKMWDDEDDEEDLLHASELFEASILLSQTESPIKPPSIENFYEYDEEDQEDLLNASELFEASILLSQPDSPIKPPSAENVYEYEGIPVKFPYKAYKCQEQMMERIVKGAKHGQHCLLESPTGTGKTAALLCGLLAWQEAEEGQNGLDPVPTSPSSTLLLSSSPHKKRKLHQRLDLPESSFMETDHGKVGIANGQSPQVILSNVIYYATRTHSQVQNVVHQLKSTHYAKTPMTILASRQQICINPVAFGSSSSSVDDGCQKLRNALTLNKANELKNDFVSLPTCSCYVPSTRGGDNETLPACSEFSKFPSRPGGGDGLAWDIEDLKSYGKSTSLCPYYGTKVLQKSAKIIFCPYNYLLDPPIRKACKIELAGNIVVFDESHNIEDVCREIGSKNLSLESIDRVIRRALDEASSGELGDIPLTKKDSLHNLDVVFTKLSRWLQDYTNMDHHQLLQASFQPSSSGGSSKYTLNLKTKCAADGISVVNLFVSLGLGPKALKARWFDYYTMNDRAYGQDYDAEAAKFKLEKKAMRHIAKLFAVLHFLYKGQTVDGACPHVNDYNILLVLTKRNQGYSQQVCSLPGLVSPPNRQYRQFINNDNNSVQIELILQCLNPAITFSKMTQARTIIVTSGTLSPTQSFASELGLKFHHELSASHVLGSNRVFTAIVQRHKNNSSQSLDFRKSNLNEHFDQHQSDLGEIILDVCKRVKYGVLVFVTSKSFLQKLELAWAHSGVLDQMKEVKDVFSETNANDGRSSTVIVQGYLEKVKEPRGAVLFAVIRGRLSEGVDFKDNQARAVITVGIPFLPMYDETVVAKKAYNNVKWDEQGQARNSGQVRDQDLREQQFLSGEDWYKATAFRALNQAFGRCVRHSEDWGIILIVDDRFITDRGFVQNLSNWVKEGLQVEGRKTVGSLESILPDLDTFLKRLQGEM